MICTITNNRLGSGLGLGVLENGEEIKVSAGFLFNIGGTIDVRLKKNNFYTPRVIDYPEENILKEFEDKDGLICIDDLKEVKEVSKKGRRVYEIAGYWFFIPYKIRDVLEYLYDNNLVKKSKIRLTTNYFSSVSRAPIINVNYTKMYNLLMEKKSPVNARFYCEKTKDYDDRIFADFYVLGILSNSEIQFELWQITHGGNELFYSHFIQDVSSDNFKHFDLATHYIDENSLIEDLLEKGIKPNLKSKVKWFRNDNNFTKQNILDITKLFFPLDELVNEFSHTNYG